MSTRAPKPSANPRALYICQAFEMPTRAPKKPIDGVKRQEIFYFFLKDNHPRGEMFNLRPAVTHALSSLVLF